MPPGKHWREGCTEGERGSKKRNWSLRAGASQPKKLLRFLDCLVQANRSKSPEEKKKLGALVHAKKKDFIEKILQ